MSAYFVTTPGFGTLVGVRIITMKPPMVPRQMRTHQRKRLNKKWRKRYGYVYVPDPSIDQSKIIHDRDSNTVYAYPPAVEELKRRTTLTP